MIDGKALSKYNAHTIIIKQQAYIIHADLKVVNIETLLIASKGLPILPNIVYYSFESLWVNLVHLKYFIIVIAILIM